jgi:phage shock protein PspC (stress-responsive transcriptional regulator)
MTSDTATSTRLERRREGRVAAGVASGLGAHLGVSVGLVRLAFVLLTILGGPGVVAYLICWAFVPAEDQDLSIGEDLLRHVLGSSQTAA